MKNEFCKIILVNGDKAQVLITKDFDNDDDASPHKVTQRTDFDNVVIAMSFCFSKKSARNKCFKEYSEDQAQKFYNSASELVTANKL